MEKQELHPPASNKLDRNSPDFAAPRDSCFLVRWFSLYSFVLLFRSVVRPLARSDLANLTQDIHPANNYREYEIVKKAAKPQDRRNVLKLLFRNTLFCEFLLSGALAIVVAGLAFSGPLVIQKIMEFLNKPGATVQEQKTAYLYAALWIGLYLVKIFLNAYCQRRLVFPATKAEQILTVELLEKITRLAPSYRMDNERSRGQLLKILTSDVGSVKAFLIHSATLFSAPATLIGVQVFLFLQVGAYGLSLLLILVLTGIVQMLLRRSMMAAKAEKKDIMGVRTLTNREMFQSIDSIKCMGWQPIITQKNLEYRQQESRWNLRQYNLLNIYDLVINLAPVLTIFLIFILLLLTQNSLALNTTLVYTVLSFVGLTFVPVKSMLTSVTAAAQGVAAFKEISEFLEYRQIPDIRIQDSTMELGTLRINNLVAAWQPYIRERPSLDETIDSKVGPSTKLNAMNQSLTKSLMGEEREVQQIENKLWADDHKKLEYEEVRKAVKFALGIPIRIELKKGERLILVSRPQAGKSTFFQTLIGNLYVLSGEVHFGGRIGYMPQKLWFRKESLRDNVLFGLPYDKKKLNFVYSMVLLKDTLKTFQKGDSTMMDESNGLTETQRRKVALARVLYSQPDLMLLDEVFAGMDPETTQGLYDNLCTHYKHTSILLSTHVTNFIRKEDRLMILKEGAVVGYGTLDELEVSPQAWKEEVQNTQVVVQNEEQLRLEQLQLKRDRMRNLKIKLRNFVRDLVALTKNMTREQIEENVFKEAERRRQRKIEARLRAVRIKPLSGADYLRYISLAPLGLHITLLILSMLTQGVKIFADWWIGSVSSLPWPLNESQILYIYIGLTAAFGVFLALSGLVGPVISAKSAANFTKQHCDSIAYASFDWHAKTNAVKVAEIANRDDAEMFETTDAAYSLFRDTLTFLATIVLVGLSSPMFLTIAAGVIIADVLIFYFYGRAASELDVFDDIYRDPISHSYEELINGIDVLRAFGKLTNPRNTIVNLYYNYTVYKINRKFLDFGMMLLTEIISLAIVAGAAFFAVRSKFNSEGIEQNVAIIGTSIAFSLKITELVAGVGWGIAAFKGGIVDYMIKPSSFIGKEKEDKYHEPAPPKGWPKDSSAKFDNVTLMYSKALYAAVNMVTLDILPRERVFMTGRSGCGKATILKAIAKQISPVRNIDLSTGKVFVGGVDLTNIGRKYVTQHVIMINSMPFMFTGTLRENIDPFGVHCDYAIKQSLEVVGAWDFLKSKQEQSNKVDVQKRLDQMISNAGCYMSLGLLQQINIARAVLAKPKIILWDTAASSLDELTEMNVLKSIFTALPETTIVVVSQKLTTATHMDRIIYMSQGRIKQNGRPRALLRKKESNPFRKMVENSQAAPKVLKILDAIDQLDESEETSQPADNVKPPQIDQQLPIEEPPKE